MGYISAREWPEHDRLSDTFIAAVKGASVPAKKLAAAARLHPTQFSNFINRRNHVPAGEVVGDAEEAPRDRAPPGAGRPSVHRRVARATAATMAAIDDQTQRRLAGKLRDWRQRQLAATLRAFEEAIESEWIEQAWREHAAEFADEHATDLPQANSLTPGRRSALVTPKATPRDFTAHTLTLCGPALTYLLCVG